MSSYLIPDTQYRGTATELLVFCARGRNGDTDRRLSRLLSGRIDWENFLKLVAYHGLSPRAYRRLKGFEVQIPADVYQRLHQGYLASVANNLRLSHWMDKVLSGFHREGIQVIPLKGIYLAEALYGDIGLRPSSDIDLLVREEDLGRVQNLLQMLGYRRIAKSISENLARFGRHWLFIPDRPDVGGCIEVHWNFYLAQPRKLDMRPVWERAVPRQLNGQKVLTLSPADLLFHLTLQQRLHGYKSLKIYSDLADLLGRYPEMDWKYIIARASESGQRVGIYYALQITRELLSAEVPGWVLGELRPCWVRNYLVERIINKDAILYYDGAPTIHLDLIRMLTNDSILDTLKILGRLATIYSQDIASRYGIPVDRPGRLLKIMRKILESVSRRRRSGELVRRKRRDGPKSGGIRNRG